MERKNGFVYVEPIKLWVAEERSLLGKNFYECQEALHSQNQKMLTMPEFVGFLKYTKQNHPDIYHEITKDRSKWKAEWLDANFKVKRKDLDVKYHVFENGKIVKKSEKLDANTLMKDKTPGISLEDWLKNLTGQGFPSENVKNGDLCYSFPRGGRKSVVGFGVDVDGRTNLNCGWDPSAVFPTLGVREVRKEL